MAKPKLSELTNKWISGKTEKQKSIKNINTVERQNSNDKIRQTVIVSRKVNRLLWINRLNTGKTLSKVVEELVLKHLKEENIKPV